MILTRSLFGVWPTLRTQPKCPARRPAGSRNRTPPLAEASPGLPRYRCFVDLQRYYRGMEAGNPPNAVNYQPGPPAQRSSPAELPSSPNSPPSPMLCMELLVANRMFVFCLRNNGAGVLHKYSKVETSIRIRPLNSLALNNPNKF